MTRRSWSRPTRALATAPSGTIEAPVKVLPVGRDRKNQAIVALAVRTAPSAVTRSVFVSVANLDLERAGRRLEVWGDGGLIEARDLVLDPQTRSDVVIDDVPTRRRHVVEVRLVGPDADRHRGARPARGRRPRLGGRSRPTGRARSCSSVPATRISRPPSPTCPNVRAVRTAAERVSGEGGAAPTAPAGISSSSRRTCRRPCRARRSSPSRRPHPARSAR